jgi:hypothetical protein
VRRVVEAGGYRVAGDTGSALVADGRGRSFYIWATENAAAVNKTTWQVLARVGGVTVYGDEDLWRWWIAGDFVFWVQAGPGGDAIVPRPTELASVIDASRRVTPPTSRR